MRWACGSLAALTLSASAAAQAPADDVPPLTTDDLVRLALQNDPELTALHAEWSASLSAGVAARHALPEPRVSYTAYLLAVETRQGPQRHMVSLSQAFPWFRALRDAEDPYLADARAAAARFDAAALRVVFDIEAAMLRVARIDAVADLVADQRAVYADVLDHRLAVMRVGGAEHGTVLRMTVMIGLLDDRLADLSAARATELAGLRALVRLPGDAPLVVAPSALPDAAPDLPSVDLLTARMGERHPGLAAFAAQAEAEIERAEVAANQALPMPAVSIGWGVVGTYDDPMPGTGGGGRDVLNVGLSVPLPIFRRQYVEAEAARRTRSEAFSARADDLYWDLSAELDRALVRIREEDDRLVRYQRDLVPAAHDVTEHFALELPVGMADHTAYLLALEQELQLRAAIIDARFAIGVEVARLDMLTAGALSEGESGSEPAPRIDTYGGAQ